MSAQYRIKAKNWNGKTINEKLTANSRNHALDLLNTRELIPLALKEQNIYRSKLQTIAFKILNNIGYRPYSNRHLMIFCQQFATMLKAGISALQCLNILSRQKEISMLQKNIRAAALEVEQGSTLAASMQMQPGGFPAIMINMVEAGETSGTIDLIMEKLADHFEKQHDFTEKIRSATLYPLLIIIVAVAVMLIMIIFVLPQFSQIFNTMGMDMPVYTRFLLQFASLIREYWLLFSGCLAILIVALSCFAKTKKGRRKVDLLRLHMPFFSKLYIQTISARFARTMSTLLASGISLNSALELSDRVVDNSVFSQSIYKLIDALNHGENMSSPMLGDKYFPSLLAEMVRIGEETGALDHTMHRTALFYEKETAYVVDRLSSILEPVLLIVVGLFIGLLVYSILSPMYRVFETI